MTWEESECLGKGSPENCPLVFAAAQAEAQLAEEGEGTMTNKNIKATLEKACQAIAPGSHPAYVRTGPEPESVADHCFRNVRSKIIKDGGTEQTGWAFLVHEPPGLLVAIHHSIWVSPAGEWIDMTPPLPGTERLMEQGKIVFLPDNAATLLQNAFTMIGAARPSKAFPLTKRATKHARRVNRHEWQYAKENRLREDRR
jgi:hypothetical protein